MTIVPTSDAVVVTLPLETGSDDPTALLAAACAMASGALAAAPIFGAVEQNGARRHAETLDAWKALLRVARVDAHVLHQTAAREASRARDAEERRRARAEESGQGELLGEVAR